MRTFFWIRATSWSFFRTYCNLSMPPGMIVHIIFACVGPYLGSILPYQGDRLLWDQGDMLVFSEHILNPLHISWCVNPLESLGYRGIYGIRGIWLSFLISHYYLSMQSGMQAYYTFACLALFLGSIIFYPWINGDMGMISEPIS